MTVKEKDYTRKRGEEEEEENRKTKNPLDRNKDGSKAVG